MFLGSNNTLGISRSRKLDFIDEDDKINDFYKHKKRNKGRNFSSDIMNDIKPSNILLNSHNTRMKLENIQIPQNTQELDYFINDYENIESHIEGGPTTSLQKELTIPTVKLIKKSQSKKKQGKYTKRNKKTKHSTNKRKPKKSVSHKKKHIPSSKKKNKTKR